MIILIVFAFIAGLVTILSPCILPVLPIVLSGTAGGGKSKPWGIVLGFVASFTFFTLFLSAIVKATGIGADSVRLLSVVILFLFGVSLLWPGFQVLLEKLFDRLASFSPRSDQRTGFWGGLIVGLSLGLIWTPCVGPILAGVISLALTGSVSGGAVLITLSYALGTAIPMLLIMYGGRKLLNRNQWLAANTGKIQKAFGVVMILVAGAIYLNFDRKFQTLVLEVFPSYGTGLTQLENNSAVQLQLQQLTKPGGTTNVKPSVIDSLMKKTYTEAPEIIPGGEWFNVDNANGLRLADLKGKVVLVDFWTYTCINCIRTLPYIKSWDDKYADQGLVIIGVHTPEFEFEKNADNVAKAIADFGIKYPVVQDNNYATWKAYDNHYWPAHYLVDKNGKIRDKHFGEGAYDETEKKIQELLAETGADVSNVPVDNPTYQVEAQTPETYLGYNRIEALASPEKLQSDVAGVYSIPTKLPIDQFAFGGTWTIGPERAKPDRGAKIWFNFKAMQVYLVMGPTDTQPGKVTVMLDGKPVGSAGGEDVVNNQVTVDEDRLYKLVKFNSAENHTLELIFDDGNVGAFAFTFG